MRFLSMAVVFCVGLLCFAGHGMADDVPKATAQEAEQAAIDWLDGLGDTGLEIDESLDEGGFVLRDIAGSGSVMAVLSQDGWAITLGFSQPISADTPLETVQERLTFVALDRLPTPGLDVAGWDIRPRTPTSSIRDKEAISITGFEDGKLTLHVETRCFALNGRDPSVRVPADAPMPDGSYFQVRRDFALLLHLEAPIDVQ